jgi:hypothetical protein
MHKCIVAFSILLTPALWAAQPVKMTAKSSNLSKPAQPVSLPQLLKPTQGTTSPKPSQPTQSTPSQSSNSAQSNSYSFDFTDPNSAPTLGGRWVSSERLVVQKGNLVFAQFTFAQSGGAAIVAAVQQQYGAPTPGKGDVLATWTAANNLIVVSADDRPTLTIEDKQYMSKHQ